jgi:hypothetical protein
MENHSSVWWREEGREENVYVAMTRDDERERDEEED